jgi:uncharacterized protein
MSTTATIPGLYYKFVQPTPDQSPLRSDVAAFLGKTQRGPVGIATRVEGWREYGNIFGGLINDALTPYAVRGYFDNLAQTAYVVRLLGMGSQTATSKWTVGEPDKTTGNLGVAWPGDSGLTTLGFQVVASSPGAWANGTVIRVRYWARGSSGKPEMEVEIAPPNEPVEILSNLSPATLAADVNAKSLFVRFEENQLPPTITPSDLIPPKTTHGPRYLEWKSAALLTDGVSVDPEKRDYLNAAQAVGDEVEVALTACPDLHSEKMLSEEQRTDVITTLLVQADDLHDREVILDIPPALVDAVEAVKWVADLRKKIFDEKILRGGAVYYPRVRVLDPLGGVTEPLRCIPCSGSVLGVISRLDQQLGPYATPANAQLYETFDLSMPLDAKEQTTVYEGGINLLKCSPSNGLLVWGGRVLGARDPGKSVLGGFLAHRRLIHVLVRAIRRVAEPLVFETNGPQLWLALVRGITSVLLEAYRAGALQGTRPEEAFLVKCDETTNPPDQMEEGRCFCQIQVSPAVPMEFITLRVAVSNQGKLEVFET